MYRVIEDENDIPGGYEGDGFFCKSTRSCQLDPSLCHPQAVCVSDSQSSFGFSCRCQEGFTGDGHHCLGKLFFSLHT
ncbi:Stabilin-2 [Portunus trituberculatus]|uniref:Stabilin-2 n=1 Tax=Portunus trituberculatus TaxID=210409 RepID=A0A5B7FIK6_PORTR|nr:Stabilin-2 [Portunus trituberculatus]